MATLPALYQRCRFLSSWASNIPRTWPFSASKPAAGKEHKGDMSEALAHNWYISLLLTSHWGELGPVAYKGSEKVASGWVAASQLLYFLERRTDFGEQLVFAITLNLFFPLFSHSFLFINGMHGCSVTQSCLTLCDPVDYSPPGSSVHGLFQARILKRDAISFSEDLPDQGIKPTSLAFPSLAGGFFITEPPRKSINGVHMCKYM